MMRFVVVRAFESLVVLALMSFVVYALIGLMPGDPIDIMLAGDPNMTPEDRERLRQLFGLHLPIWERYGNWLVAAIGGDFGFSRTFNRPVLEVMAPNLGRTALLMMSSFVLSVAIAIPLGLAAAVRQRRLADYGINLFCFAGKSVPPFWLALMLILVFAVELNWFPAGGIETVGASGIVDRVRHLALPVACLTLLNLASVARLMRAEAIGALRQDYVRTARAKGLAERRVIWGHAMRNALNPVVTVIALEFGTLFSGALITETVFAYPGMGKMIYDAILGNDYNLALIGLLFATLLVLVGNLAADLGYAALDPRISYR
ncbi:MAG TPA: ABC transporter permease [Alphaproteobacteria bacterium]|jgi:peptide/nickel transport system permease protein